MPPLITWITYITPIQDPFFSKIEMAHIEPLLPKLEPKLQIFDFRPVSPSVILDKDRMEIGGYLASNHDESSLLKMNKKENQLDPHQRNNQSHHKKQTISETETLCFLWNILGPIFFPHRCI